MVSAKGKLGFALTEKVETGKPLLLLTHTKTLFEDFAWEAVIVLPSSVQRQYREKLVSRTTVASSALLCVWFVSRSRKQQSPRGPAHLYAGSFDLCFRVSKGSLHVDRVVPRIVVAGLYRFYWSRSVESRFLYFCQPLSNRR